MSKKMVKQMIKHQAYLDTGYHAKGRIKRMRSGESKCNGILRRIHGTSIVLFRNDPNFYEQMLHKITRWTRH